MATTTTTKKKLKPAVPRLSSVKKSSQVNSMNATPSDLTKRTKRFRKEQSSTDLSPREPKEESNMIKVSSSPAASSPRYG